VGEEVPEPLHRPTSDPPADWSNGGVVAIALAEVADLSGREYTIFLELIHRIFHDLQEEASR
jgi:hypothetical protein